MAINGWRYYNHAVVPTTAPHECPDLSPIEDKSIWKKIGGNPLLARWITDFDCGYETNWWYIIKYSPFSLDALDAKARKHIRQALRKNEVRMIDPSDYAVELCAVYNKACEQYQGYKGVQATPQQFKSKAGDDWWCAFNLETGKIIGYMVCRKKAQYIDTVVSKYDPQYLNQRASDAIHCTILQYYLNEKGYNYVSSGNRNISHITNVQDYKINTFGFKKAYCKLHIACNPKFAWLITILFPFRKLFGKLKKVSICGKIYGLLKLVEIAKDERNCR